MESQSAYRAPSKDVKTPAGDRTQTADLYAILGVKRDAKRDDIVAAYKRRVKEVHPDAGGSSDAFQAVGVAYRILRDAELRAKYDTTGIVEERALITEAELVRNELINLFAAFLSGGALHDKRMSIIDSMRGMVSERIVQVNAQITKLNSERDDLQSLKKSISRTGEGVNLFARECDRKIDENRKNHATMDKTLYMTRKIQDELGFYKSEARMVESQTAEQQFGAFFQAADINELMRMMGGAKAGGRPKGFPFSFTGDPTKA